MAAANDANAGGLARVLGRWDLTAVGVNQVIGSGIFVLPAAVAALVGVASSVWPFILAGVANVLIVLCFAEVATRFRSAGGPYVYAREAFGPFVGFEVAWMLWLTRLASLAALAIIGFGILPVIVLSFAITRSRPGHTFKDQAP